MRLFLAIQEKARHVAQCDGLDEQLDPGNPRLLRRPGKILGVDAEQVRAIHSRRGKFRPWSGCAGIAIPARTPEPAESRREIPFAAGQRRDAALAGLPVAGRRVEEDLAQSVFLEQSGQRGGRMLVGEQVLDSREAIARSRGKAVEELVFLIHHGQVGGKARHGMDSVIRCKRM